MERELQLEGGTKGKVPIVLMNINESFNVNSSSVLNSDEDSKVFIVAKMQFWREPHVGLFSQHLNFKAVFLLVHV